MPSPFSRTIRSIDADSFRVSMIALVIALLVLAVWCAWFFMARVSVYKVSPKVWLTGEETVTSGFLQNSRRSKEVREAGIVAQFSREDMADIRPGQEATLYLKMSGKLRTIPAKVTRIVRQGNKEWVRLSSQIDVNSQIRLRKGAGGEIKIAVEHISPAAMVMRASGLFADTPRISASPRNSGG